ncbi:MAG: methyltransferase [Sulfurimonas sp.]|uniref:tRNA1(Val) (adenine(37)-N6)-methyltransferase n=1 Tax=Sulfurimonas sp. TaxID=2022749 RepID=UPI0025FB792F|nr:methyltransferase [Sulfurimonas sp.]MCK9491095.1 methyltransferase [Sulfurimonas sp.]
MLLYQPEVGYCYNSDSIFLYDFISSFNPKGRVLDVGAGCGIVGLLVARDNPKVMLEAIEKQEAFVEYATNNARVNKIDYKIHKKDFLDFEDEKKYDYIISNPPFYSDNISVSKNDMLFNARYNINLPLRDFFKKVSQLLKPRAHFIFCYDASQFGLICAELERFKLRAVNVRFVHPKIDKGASLVMIHVRNGSSSLMNIQKPMVSFDGEEFTQEVKEIYKKASTKSVKCHL